MVQQGGFGDVRRLGFVFRFAFYRCWAISLPTSGGVLVES